MTSHPLGTDLTVRLYEPSDHAFVLDSWRKSHRGQSRENPGGQGHLALMPKRLYDERQEVVVDMCLEASTTVVIELVREPGMNIGYLCGNRDKRLMHFLYIGGLYRQRGFGGLLLRYFFTPGRVTVTQWTPKLKHYLRRWNLTYDPYVISEVMHAG